MVDSSVLADLAETLSCALLVRMQPRSILDAHLASQTSRTTSQSTSVKLFSNWALGGRRCLSELTREDVASNYRGMLEIAAYEYNASGSVFLVRTTPDVPEHRFPIAFSLTLVGCTSYYAHNNTRTTTEHAYRSCNSLPAGFGATAPKDANLAHHCLTAQPIQCFPFVRVPTRTYD